MTRTMNELYELVGQANSAKRGANHSTDDRPMTVNDFNQSLSGHMGRPDLGFLGNMSIKSHENALKKGAYNAINEEKYRIIADLSVQALKGQAELLREKLKVDWNRQYSVLSEQSAVAEMTVIRKLEHLHEVGRELLYDDRGDVLDRVQKRYDAGKLSDSDFERELKYYISRCDKLLLDFENIVNRRGDAVRNAYRSQS